MKKFPFNDSKLGIDERVNDLIARLSLKEKIGLLSTGQKAIPRLKIKKMAIGCEVARGFVSRDKGEPSTVFPQPIGLASTFDGELMEKLGEIASTEARYYHNQKPERYLTLWGPTVDPCHNPLWGRTEECYGEDPFLAGELSTRYGLGMRGKVKDRLKTVTTLKHFCANSNEETRTTISANVTPRLLAEYYYKAYEPSIKAGAAQAIMTSYNKLAGLPAALNPDVGKLLTKKWGLTFSVTDGGGFTQIITTHKFTETHAETLAMAIKAGVNVMTDSTDCVTAAAEDALARGLISEADIDRVIRGTLTARFMLGEFDERDIYADIPRIEVNSAEAKAVNLRAATEAVTLLKNNGILPIDKNNKPKIALIGNSANAYFMDWYTGITDYYVTIFDAFKAELGEKAVTDDGYDRVALRSEKNGKLLRVREGGEAVFDGDEIAADTLFAYYDFDDEIMLRSESNGKFLFPENGSYAAVSESNYRWYSDEILRPESFGSLCRLKNRRGVIVAIDETGHLRERKKYSAGNECMFSIEIISSGAQRAKELAKTSDYIIVCAGNDPMTVARECYDRKTLDLPKHIRELCTVCFSANTRTILTLVSSYPYAIAEENEHLPAVIYTAHGGPEMGNAVRDVIFGLQNPSGRTPLTWYRDDRQLPPLEDYDISKNNLTYLYMDEAPLYPFGYGLSYSEFIYSNFKVVKTKKGYEATVSIKNISNRDGAEVAELYLKHPRAKERLPKRQLCGFSRVLIPAGETREITITVPLRELMLWDNAKEKLCLFEGDYTFFIGGSSDDAREEQILFVAGEKPSVRVKGKKYYSWSCDDFVNTEFLYDKKSAMRYAAANYSSGYILFSSVCLDGVKSVMVEAASAFLKKIDIFLDSPNGGKIAELSLNASSDPQSFKRLTAKLSGLNGIHDLYVIVPDNTNVLSFKVN